MSSSVRKYTFILVAASISVALLSLFIDSSLLPSFPLPRQRLFAAEELGLYNGTDEALPILLAILGSVFDVTKGKSHYGTGGGYHHFAGSSGFVGPINSEMLPVHLSRKTLQIVSINQRSWIDKARLLLQTKSEASNRGSSVTLFL